MQGGNQQPPGLTPLFPTRPTQATVGHPASALHNTHGPQGHAFIMETGEGSAQTGAYILKD